MDRTLATEVRGRLRVAGLTQHDLARELRMSPASVSLWLNGLKILPHGVTGEDVVEAVGRLEAAERAADEARERVLAGGA